jgi:hypothetical protein
MEHCDGISGKTVRNFWSVNAWHETPRRPRAAAYEATTATTARRANASISRDAATR